MEKKYDKLALFQSKNGAIQLKSDYKNDTIWASKKQISELFKIDRSIVSRHINNIFKDEELDK